MSLLAALAADGLMNEDAASLLDGEPDTERRTAVLVGVTGDGKSSTGNTLSGAEPFDTSGGFKSRTQECSHADYLRDGCFWRIIDTIGLHDTGLPQNEVLDRFSTFADLTPEGIDAFLFVIRWGRFKPEHDAALTAFLANCGEVALRHTILVFTFFKGSDEELWRALCEDSPEALRTWLPRVQGAVGIDNQLAAATGSDAGKQTRSKVHSVLDRMLATNSGLRYTNEVLAEARAKMSQREEAEKIAFAAAVDEWRKGTGPVAIERLPGVVTRPAGAWMEGVVTLPTESASGLASDSAGTAA